MTNDLIPREVARRIIDSPRSKEQMLGMLQSVPSVSAESGDLISRAEADALFQQAIDSKSPNLKEDWKKLIWVREHIKDLPTIQPTEPRKRMKLIIDIPEEVLTDINESTYPNDRLVGEAIYAIKNGTPLAESEEWKQLKETIAEIRDNNQFKNYDVTLMSKFLFNYMGVLERGDNNADSD